MEDLFKFAEALSPHPQQNVIKSIYNDNEQFLPPMPPTILTSYPNMNTCMGGLYQGEMGLSACNGGQGQQLFSYGILPMRMPASNLMPTTMRRPMSILKTNYQNNNVRPYNLHDTFLPCGYKPTNLQVLKNRLQQQQPHNNLSSVTFSGTYACRKTLADSRPRVRGRFAKNDGTEQMASFH
ncbi:hypothetical protein IEQ34_010250 [Dendrobium chrysotoxum]|uniref:CCT domain-containing protein n=1 Tax=Dendrobium chrysotoxum TaxID=161865 RepID=A0AAV7GLD8_DENCH|nr:hypothetical protein IEQ34_010250 [Dendrobium chrysotoxum]